MLKAVILVLVLIGGYFLADQLRVLDPEFPVHQQGFVMVTGGSSGLGWDMIWYILERAPVKVSVIATVRKDSDEQALQAERVKRGFGEDRLIVVRMDVSNLDSIIAGVQSLSALDAPIFALVNNAGVSESSFLKDSKNIDTIIDANVKGLLHLTQRMLPFLSSAGAGARLVNIGSLAGFVAGPQSSVYSASKFAVEGLSDSLRLELRKQYNIAVSIVEPGYVASKMCHDPKKCVDHPVVVSEVVFDALFHARPRSRYPVASAGPGLPAHLLRFLSKSLPDRFIDLLIIAFGPKKDV